MKYLGIFFISFLLCSCATTFQVGINSFSQQNSFNHQTFILLPGNKNTNANDLEFMEYSKYIEKALLKQGLIKETDFNKADLGVLVSYGIGNPEQSSFNYSVPVFGQTGTASTYTSGNISTYGNTASYSATTIAQPKYGVTGYQTYQGRLTEYTRYILLTAYDLSTYRETKVEKTLWDTRIISIGSSGDLRRVFPVMMGASLNYITKDTGKMVHIDLDETDSRVLFIKGEDSDLIEQ